MEIVFTKHALDKLIILKRLGWSFSQKKVRSIITNPKWYGVSRFGQKTAMDLVDDSHILRIIYNQEDDIIKIVTIHIARRGKYESTL